MRNIALRVAALAWPPRVWLGLQQERGATTSGPTRPVSGVSRGPAAISAAAARLPSPTARLSASAARVSTSATTWLSRGPPTRCSRHPSTRNRRADVAAVRRSIPLPDGHPVFVSQM